MIELTLEQIEGLLSKLLGYVQREGFDKRIAHQTQVRKAANAAGYHVRVRQRLDVRYLELRGQGLGYSYVAETFDTFEELEAFLRQERQ
jgi:hypothetical protein